MCAAHGYFTFFLLPENWEWSASEAAWKKNDAKNIERTRAVETKRVKSDKHNFNFPQDKYINVNALARNNRRRCMYKWHQQK